MGTNPLLRFAGQWAEDADYRPFINAIDWKKGFTPFFGGPRLGFDIVKMLSEGALVGAQEEYKKSQEIQDFTRTPEKVFRLATAATPVLGPMVGRIATLGQEQGLPEALGATAAIPFDPAVLAGGIGTLASSSARSGLRAGLRNALHMKPKIPPAPIPVVEEALEQSVKLADAPPRVKKLGADGSGGVMIMPDEIPVGKIINVDKPTKITGIATDKDGTILQLKGGRIIRVSGDKFEVGNKFAGEGTEFSGKFARGKVDISGGPNKWHRGFFSSKENIAAIPFIGKTIDKRIRDYKNFAETEAGKFVAARRQLTENLNAEQQRNVVDVLDGKLQIDGLDDLTTKAVLNLRKMLDDVAERARKNKVFSGYRDTYFPHKFKADGEWDFKTTPGLDPQDSKRYGNLEKAREKNRSDYRRDLDVLDEYGLDAYRRISEAKHLGKELKRVLPDKFRLDQKSARLPLERTVRRETGREALTAVGDAVNEARHAVALGALSRAAVYQLGAVSSIQAAAGMRRTIKAGFEMMKDYKGARHEALRSGSTIANELGELTAAAGGAGKISRMTGGKLYGIPTADRMMRILADKTGRIMHREALAGDKAALKDIQRMGFKDPSKFTPDQIGKAVSDKTNYRTGVLDLPEWSTTIHGKVLSQFNTFMYRHARFVGEITNQAFKGDPKPLLRYLGSGLVAGEVIADLRAALFGENSKGSNDLENKDFWMGVERSSHPVQRAIQNLMAVGGAGVWQTLFESASRFDAPNNIMVGALGSEASRLYKAGKAVVTEGDTKPLGRYGLSKVPFAGGILARQIPRNKKKKKKNRSPFQLNLMESMEE